MQTLNFSFVKLHENPNITLQSELAVFVSSTKMIKFHGFTDLLVYSCANFGVILRIFQEKQP